MSTASLSDKLTHAKRESKSLKAQLEASRIAYDELRRGKEGDGQLTHKEKYDVEGWVLVHDPLYPEQFKAIT